MKCPNCQFELQLVKTESHYGRFITLDQCPNCGGIWFDRSKFSEVKHGEAEKIDLDKKILMKDTFIKDSLFCPKDNLALSLYKDPAFPKELIFYKCNNCEGFWFNRGYFKKYQDYRKAKMENFEKNELEKKVKLILEAKNEPKSPFVNLCKYLTTPYQPAKTYSRNKADLAVDIITIAVQTLLRLFLKM
ncbi:MAG: zf-TFIIB domain-containing protein [Candidatus Levybacteria bacterium]|nr:zf-TFIIB domain-containing protein [Candidatus Levybacteria bacterium]